MPEPVQILAVRRSPTFLPDGSALTMIEVQFSAVGLPIGRIFVPEDQDTPLERQRRIRAFLDEQRGTIPNSLVIPDA